MTPILLALFIFAAPHASASSPREELKTLTAQLQKNPSDDSLREKIVKLAAKAKPAPGVSEEARRHFVKAVTLQKDAKDAEGYRSAVSAYDQALLIAPWWPEAYYNRSVALELLGRFEEAASSLKLYLASAPKGVDARAAQDHVYALEAKMESAQKTAAAEAERRKRAIEGNWGPEDESVNDVFFRIERVGGTLVVKPLRNTFTVSDVQVSETKLSMTLSWGDNRVPYVLELRDDALVGTLLASYLRPTRYVRKP
jgi:tetratricopeptide (TPR) repeat protein